LKTKKIDNILLTEKSTDYELLDSGAGLKLERFGNIILSRPDPQAIWQKSLAEIEWKRADAFFERTGVTGKWSLSESSKYLTSRSTKWAVTIEGLSFELQLLPSKHIGIFPEQSANWKWLEEKIKTCQPGRLTSLRVLNLFGYTGGASLACLKAGAEVCHVDASEFAVDLAHKNMELSGLFDKKIRFIVDDVRKFVEREIKRGNKYDIVLMDPPVYGKGAKGEVWKIEEDLLPLLSRIKNILAQNPIAIVLNGYASVYSHITYGQMLETITSDLDGNVTSGELVIQQSGSDRVLPCGIFARFEN
jgi:23S rRNA (cytosine1962-C5)-methyltransferase